MNMTRKFSFKKGQGLPLNTIVLAILVIIVLLVIVVFFTTRVGEAGKQLDTQSTTACESTNPALSTAGYIGFASEDQYNSKPDQSKWSKVPGIADCYASKTETGSKS